MCLFCSCSAHWKFVKNVPNEAVLVFCQSGPCRHFGQAGCSFWYFILDIFFGFLVSRFLDFQLPRFPVRRSRSSSQDLGTRGWGWEGKKLDIRRLWCIHEACYTVSGRTTLPERLQRLLATNLVLGCGGRGVRMGSESSSSGSGVSGKNELRARRTRGVTPPKAKIHRMQVCPAQKASRVVMNTRWWL